MKYTTYIFIILVFMSMAGNCKKDLTSLQQLQPPTQIGAGTFGCLVNGKDFLAHLTFYDPHPTISCAYRTANLGATNYYTFQVNAVGGFSSEDKPSMTMGVDSLPSPLYEGEIITLDSTNTSGRAYARFVGAKGLFDISDSAYMPKPPQYTGQLTITHLDTTQNILSGTFRFNAINKAGATVEVTNGRFDLIYAH